MSCFSCDAHANHCDHFCDSCVQQTKIQCVFCQPPDEEKVPPPKRGRVFIMAPEYIGLSDAKAECPNCERRYYFYCTTNSSKKQQLTDVNGNFTCHTMSCACDSSGGVLTTQQAATLEQLLRDPTLFDEWCSDMSPDEMRLNMQKDGDPRIPYAAGDQIPQHLNTAVQKALGIVLTNFRIVLNVSDEEGGPFTVVNEEVQ